MRLRIAGLIIFCGATVQTIFEIVRQSMRKRTEACILAEIGYFQQFL